MESFIRSVNCLCYLSPAKHRIPYPPGYIYTHTNSTQSYAFVDIYTFTNRHRNSHRDITASSAKLPIYCDCYVREQGVQFGDRQPTDAVL